MDKGHTFRAPLKTIQKKLSSLLRRLNRGAVESVDLKFIPLHAVTTKVKRLTQKAAEKAAPPAKHPHVDPPESVSCDVL